MINKDRISERFKMGKTLLNSASHHEAIEVFIELINETAPFINEDNDAKITWETSLINSGTAKCELGYSSRDKALYEAGLEDFRTASGVVNEEDKYHSAAVINLEKYQSRIGDFD